MGSLRYKEERAMYAAGNDQMTLTFFFFFVFCQSGLPQDFEGWLSTTLLTVSAALVFLHNTHKFIRMFIRLSEKQKKDVCELRFCLEGKAQRELVVAIEAGHTGRSMKHWPVMDAGEVAIKETLISPIWVFSARCYFLKHILIIIEDHWSGCIENCRICLGFIYYIIWGKVHQVPGYSA